MNDAGSTHRVEGGQPVRPTPPFSIGVVVEQRRIHGVVTDLNGEIVRVSRQSGQVETPGQHPGVRALDDTHPDSVVSGIAELVTALRSLHADLEEQFLGIGISVGGHVNGRAGEVMRSPQLGWETPVPLANLLRLATGLNTVVVENDVNALAMGALFFGDVTPSTPREDDVEAPSTFAVVSLRTGIGVGLVFKAELYRGVSGGAGELGHFPIVKAGQQCICGKRGCLETIAGGAAILRALNARRGGNEIKTVGDAAALVEQGDQAAHDAFAAAGDALGRGLAGLVNLLNLPLVILCGEPAMLTCEPYISHVRLAFEHEAFSTTASDCSLRLELRTRQLEARGAASIVFEDLADHPSG